MRSWRRISSSIILPMCIIKSGTVCCKPSTEVPPSTLTQISTNSSHLVGMNFHRAYSYISANWRFSVEGIEQKAQIILCYVLLSLIHPTVIYTGQSGWTYILLKNLHQSQINNIQSFTASTHRAMYRTFQCRHGFR